MIESYSFGRIVIGGRVYTRDVIIYTTTRQGPTVVRNWWRAEGHLLQYEDILEKKTNKLIWGMGKEEPDVLVLGTGAYGLMKVPAELCKKLEALGIKVFVQRTPEACAQYNELIKRLTPFCHSDRSEESHPPVILSERSGRVIAALHLTC